MATVTVSDKSGLMKALNSADAGDRIELKSGNYGSLSLNGKQNADYKFDGITITSADASKPAVFNAVSLIGVTNVTFDKITLDYNSNSGTSKPFWFDGDKGVSIINSIIDGMTKDGYGTGQGLWVKNSAGFRVENTDIRNFTKGLAAFSSDDLKIIGNSFDGSAEDAMYFNRIDGARIEGNSVEMKARPGMAHQDAIQFGNDVANDTSRDIVIRGNVLEASEGGVHGIYMGNYLDAYENVTIENNTIRSDQVLGIAVGKAVGVKISNNTVLQHSAVDSTNGAYIPLIRVDKDSKQVSITGNTTHKTPEAVEPANNWMGDNYKPSGWTIANNTIVPLGTTGGSSGGGSVAPSAPSAPSLPAGDGEADDFRYNGNNIDGTERVTFKNVDFKEGDRIILSNFDNGTFRHYAGDNAVSVNADRTWVKINSLIDIQELVTASPDVKAVFQTTNNTLVMRIEQDDGTLNIALPGYAAAYKATFDNDLF